MLIYFLIIYIMINEKFCFVIKNGKEKIKFDSCTSANTEFFKEKYNTAKLVLVVGGDEIVIFDNKA